MTCINRGGHFLLTETVKKNHLAKYINRWAWRAQDGLLGFF
jgi:hypothetical protein